MSAIKIKTLRVLLKLPSLFTWEVYLIAFVGIYTVKGEMKVKARGIFAENKDGGQRSFQVCFAGQLTAGLS